jgi:hypothetical protein
MDELDVEPRPETKGLQAEIMVGGAPPVPV